MEDDGNSYFRTDRSICFLVLYILFKLHMFAKPKIVLCIYRFSDIYEVFRLQYTST